jgi:hypothetical protein
MKEFSGRTDILHTLKCKRFQLKQMRRNTMYSVPYCPSGVILRVSELHTHPLHAACKLDMTDRVGFYVDKDS